MPRNPKDNRSGLILALTILTAIAIAATGFVIYLCIDMANTPMEPPQSDNIVIQLPVPPTTQAPSVPPTTLPEPEHVVSTATLGVQGDLLMHKPIFAQGSVVQAGGTYDFSSIFQYLTGYVDTYDFAMANLETTLAGDSHVYQGNPKFNTPDAFADALVDAGYDMLLTANNHCYDTEMTGLTRTLEQLRQRELGTLGTRLDENEKRYSVVEVNGVKLGLVCYTYTTSMEGSRPRLNGNAPVQEPALVNWFANNRLDALYGQLEEIYAAMRQEGAEATVLFLHWGEEYQLAPNATQTAIAQRVCDMGFDAIVGGHPHVVQPMALLTSNQNPDHKTVCLYSMGNAVSNQRIAEMRLKTGHTEDGVIFTLSFEKYSDGTVYLSGADVLPTWVNLHSHNGGREYDILPLDSSTRGEWQSRYRLTDWELTSAQASYDRTMALVGDGLEECQEYLNQQKQIRDAHYLAMATNH